MIVIFLMSDFLLHLTILILIFKLEESWFENMKNFIRLTMLSQT